MKEMSSELEQFKVSEYLEKLDKVLEILKNSFNNEDSPINKFEQMVQRQKALTELLNNTANKTNEEIEEIL